MTRVISLWLLALCTAIPAFAGDSIDVSEAWVRLPPPVSDSAAGYLQLNNTSDKEVTIVGITSSAAAHSVMHDMEMKDDMMRMFPLPTLVIPAGGSISFEPGGKHIMLMGLTKPLQTGDMVALVLQFSDSSTQEIHATVRDMRSHHNEEEHQHGH